eukprot:355053-Chlamydomonas_euryale.AAC.5
MAVTTVGCHGHVALKASYWRASGLQERLQRTVPPPESTANTAGCLRWHQCTKKYVWDGRKA